MKKLCELSLLLGLAMLALAGCAQPGSVEGLPPLAPSPASSEQPAQPTISSVTTTAISTSVVQPTIENDLLQATSLPLREIEDDEFVSKAREDLAQRLGLAINEVKLVSALHTEFTAQAFFCQAVKERITRDAPPEIIEGQLILLSAAGATYEYHANENSLVFCREKNKIRP